MPRAAAISAALLLTVVSAEARLRKRSRRGVPTMAGDQKGWVIGAAPQDGAGLTLRAVGLPVLLKALSLVAVLAGSGPAAAQLPPGVFAGVPDLHAAPAGAYTLDPEHTAVIVKVSHIGYGFSVFRFDKVQGRLDWHPEAPESTRLDAKVATASISTPVPGFAKSLAGDGYLKSDRYPEASFVATAFHASGALRGSVSGNFTLMGVTKPLTFAVTLQGAGKGFMGQPRIGITATGAIHPQDFGFGALFDRPMPIEIDAEFTKD